MTPDLLAQFVDNITVFGLIASIAGGFFGALIGGNIAFVFTGVMILLSFGIAFATGSTMGFDYLAFGPLFGPHVAFAGGAAAAAYAHGKKNLLADSGLGRDVNSPLGGLGHPDVLLVGSIFGLAGYLFQKAVTYIPWFGTHTDSVAFTVVTSGIVARLMFSKTPVFSWTKKLEGTSRWLDWQEKPAQFLTIGAFSGLMAAGTALALTHYAYDANSEIGDTIMANAQALPFAISALCIIFLPLGLKMPVTHHITISAALAAVKFYPIVGHNIWIALIIGVLFGMFAAFLAEVMQRLMYAGGDTHIDPPAAAIWPTNTLVCLGVLLFA